MAEDPPGDRPQFIPPPPRERPLFAERIVPVPPEPSPLPPPPVPAVVKRNLLDWVGGRADRRPEPRLGLAVAAAGAAMLVVGALSIGGDQLAPSGGEEGSQYPGVFLTLAVIAVGVALAARFRHGPLAAAGVAASTVALPPFLFFLTFSTSSAPPFNAILFMSTVGWLIGYLAGPARGHALYLASALIGAWLWWIEATENLFSFPIDFLVGLANNGFRDTSSLDSSAPDATNIGLYTLVFAVAYLVVGRILDRRQKRGIATPFAFAGIVTLVIAITTLSDDLEQVGTGVAFAVAGLVLCYLGATESRRATNWVGAALVFLGLTIVVGDQFDTASSFGLAEILVGLAAIAAAHWVVVQFHEPPETDAVLSRFYRVGSVQPSGPPPPPAGSVLG